MGSGANAMHARIGSLRNKRTLPERAISLRLSVPGPRRAIEGVMGVPFWATRAQASFPKGTRPSGACRNMELSRRRRLKTDSSQALRGRVTSRFDWRFPS